MVNFYNYTGSNFALKKSVQIQFSAFTFLCILVESIMFVIHKLWSRQVFQKHLSVVTVVTLRFDFLHSFIVCTHCYAFQVQRYLSQHFFFCIRFTFSCYLVLYHIYTLSWESWNSTGKSKPGLMYVSEKGIFSMCHKNVFLFSFCLNITFKNSFPWEIN